MAFRSFESVSISRRTLFRSGGYLAAGSALAGLPFGRALLAHDVSAQWPNVAAKIDQYVAARKLPSIVAAFGWGKQDPHVVARGTLKFNGKAEAGLDSLYRIYSMSKPVTGMAVMMLIDDGKLGLDQPLGEVLPAFAEMRVLKREDGPLDDTVPTERPITIRHLLTHTAGIGYDIISKGPLRQAYLDNGIVSGQVSRMPIPGIPVAKAAPGLEEWANRLAKLPLIAQPGTKWSYSASIDLLGRVVEVASGQSFDTFLKERLFDPCGMDSTFFRVPKEEASRYTDNYGVLAGMTLPIDPADASIYLDQPPILWGGSGLVSSPRDYDRFLKMLLGYGRIDGKRVMGELAVRVGTSNILPKEAELKGTWLEGQGFGAGGRSDKGSFGWSGAAGTLASVDFNTGLRSGLYVQYMPDNAYPVRDDFMAALKADLAAMKGGAN